MSRRRHHEHKGGHERWLISYADFITLLFAFFVVLYASSRNDQVKTSRMALAIQTAFSKLGLFTPSSAQPELAPTSSVPVAVPLVDPAILQDRQSLATLRRKLSVALAPEIARHEVSLHLSHQGLLIRLQELGFFPSGSDQLEPSSLPVLQQIATAIAPLSNPIRIEGHTDNVPIHNAQFASNWQLSTARAATLVRLFIADDHMTPARLSAAGYAQFHPIASNATAAGRQRNRRVDVVVISLQAARALDLADQPLAGAPPAVPRLGGAVPSVFQKSP